MTSTTTTTSQLADLKEARTSLSSTSTRCTLNPSSFYPTRTLTVDALGIRAFRLPIPSRQTEIFIRNSDGSEAYISTRDRLWSGNSVLSHPKLGDLIRTDYFFGPNREPILRLLQTSSVLPDEIRISRQWTSRTTRFTMPGGREYEWVYEKEKREGQRVNLVILRPVDVDDQTMADKSEKNETSANESDEGDRRIAQLVRSAETRTPGTSRCTAGNGGELQIDDAGLDACGLDQAVVVATCLVMLKKEMDRRRMIQFMAIGGAGGGS
ncbi:hypothetical protein N7532_000827 [Penicillium argentinense]|uniref:Uncharacterized protein n=1 Tax=Penicillium argentinense TaxID=1131581 RepID=A0A9W9G694_9EURO|nr:uncharacterized protein N7532_000827 [Penicillium argentinense]KAJ5112782.1 hypothetical protein N7532_000827 [Penicillium argentinense]